MTSPSRMFASPAPGVSGTATHGPLDFFKRIVQLSEMNVGLKYQATVAIDRLREHLEIREEKRLEYIYAHALMRSCIEPTAEGREVYEFLLAKFRSFDRRHQVVVVTTDRLPLMGRELNLTRFGLLEENRVELTRSFHIASAIDVDGPWGNSPLRDELLTLLMRCIAGTPHVAAE